MTCDQIFQNPTGVVTWWAKVVPQLSLLCCLHLWKWVAIVHGP